MFLGVGALIRRTLAIEPDSLVMLEVPYARIASGKDGKANDNTCTGISGGSLEDGKMTRVHLPRGISSGGIFLSRRSLCETVWPFVPC